LYQQLQEQIAPLLSKIKTKETEKDRLRKFGNEEDKRLNDALNSFDSDYQSLIGVSRKIDEYAESNKPQESERLDAKISKIRAGAREKQKELQALQPSIRSAENTVNDQERHKKNIS
jgi:uncharacterized protein YlxW (UPF0749 family)